MSCNGRTSRKFLLIATGFCSVEGGRGGVLKEKPPNIGSQRYPWLDPEDHITKDEVKHERSISKQLRRERDLMFMEEEELSDERLDEKLG